jgi:hypothetical protein
MPAQIVMLPPCRPAKYLASGMKVAHEAIFAMLQPL